MTGEGTVTGGWEFVWAAYIITWVSLAAYGAWLVARDRSQANQEPHKGGNS
jgi:heme exporter protein D